MHATPPAYGESMFEGDHTRWRELTEVVRVIDDETLLECEPYRANNHISAVYGLRFTDRDAREGSAGLHLIFYKADLPGLPSNRLVRAEVRIERGDGHIVLADVRIAPECDLCAARPSADSCPHRSAYNTLRTAASAGILPERRVPIFADLP